MCVCVWGGGGGGWVWYRRAAGIDLDFYLIDMSIGKVIMLFI